MSNNRNAESDRDGLRQEKLRHEWQFLKQVLREGTTVTDLTESDARALKAEVQEDTGRQYLIRKQVRKDAYKVEPY